MRKYMRIIFPLVVILMYFYPLQGQQYFDRNGKIESQIETLIQARFGKNYICNGFSIFDSLICYSTNEKNYRRQDPYGTLKGCILFSAAIDLGEADVDTFITGMIRDGQIVWNNYPGSKADLHGETLYSKDINNDGEVDIIISEVDDNTLKVNGPLSYFLYVLSWDGKRGKFINAFGDNGKSSLLSDGGCDLIESKTKGVMNIIAHLPSIDDEDILPKKYITKTFPSITYTWNGSLYGFWPVEKKASVNHK
jgi:hypothetical protein